MTFKAGPTDPMTQFVCDGCGRTYNLKLREVWDGKELCFECAEEAGAPLSSQETRMRLVMEQRLELAKKNLREAIDAEEVAKKKESVPVQEEAALGVSEDEPETTVPVQ